jgi:hypothetical protein
MWILQKVDQKYLGSFYMQCWRRMEMTSWTDCVRNEEALRRVKEERNILQTMKRRKANQIGHMLHGNCLEGNIISAIKYLRKIFYCRKDSGKDRSDGRMWKKT